MEQLTDLHGTCTRGKHTGETLCMREITRSPREPQVGTEGAVLWTVSKIARSYITCESVGGDVMICCQESRTAFGTCAAKRLLYPQFSSEG